MDLGIWGWVAFNAFILLMLALDLGVLHRRSHEVSLREALLWTGFVTLLALAFGAGIWIWVGQQSALEYITGYLIELSLSVDNIFVFALIFAYFRVPRAYQHRVLFWGILGALILRATMIVVGAALIARFEWVIYIFGAFLVYTGIKMLRESGPHLELRDNRIVRIARRFVPVLKRFHGDRFFVRRFGRTFATPLFLVLLVVEASDVMFAVDSIPAIFGITTDPFIVYTSNVFAILGLRALYFALAGILGLFHHLPTGLAIVLAFIGVKMLLSHWVHIPVAIALGVVAVVLAGSVIWSLMDPLEDKKDFFAG